MPAANQVWTEELTDTYDSERYPRGSLRLENPSEVTAGDATHFGERVWVFVHNDEGGAFAQGDVLEMGDDAGTGTTGAVFGEAVKSNTTAQSPGRVTGVANHAIADDSWGWVIAKGHCEIACDGNVTAGTPIVSDTAGQCTDVVANADATVDTHHAVIGIALETDAGAATLVTAIIDCL